MRSKHGLFVKHGSIRSSVLAVAVVALGLVEACTSCPDPKNPPPIQSGVYVRDVGHSGDSYHHDADSPYGKDDPREIQIDRNNNKVIVRYQRNGKSIEEHWSVASFYALTDEAE